MQVMGTLPSAAVYDAALNSILGGRSRASQSSRRPAEKTLRWSSRSRPLSVFLLVAERVQ
jgi:hypothetical protein